MGDCELVLRYFALRDENNIRGSMKSMLDRTMETVISKEEGTRWRQNYQERFMFLYELFDSRPFRLPPDKDNGRDRVSAAMYDASMVAIDSNWEHRDDIRAAKENIQARMKKVMNDPENLPILTGQQNTASGILERIELMRRILNPA